MIANATITCLRCVDKLFAFATKNNRRSVTVLVLAALALFLPGIFSLQPMDRDEPRFAQASKQMLETGDFVRIRFQDTARNNKPAGIYWLQAASVSAGQALGVGDARRTIWLYRLVSLCGAIAAVLLTYWTALAFVSRGPALLAGLLMAATLLLGVEAHLAKTDAVLLATILAAMGAFARMYLGPEQQGAEQQRRQDGSWRMPVIFWSAIGLGLLIKGPITPMVPLFAGLALWIADRRVPWFARLRPLPGVILALLIALPWFVLIIIETKGGFLADSVGKDMLAKVSSGKESHGAPPLMYFAAFWLTGWPMAPLAALAAPFVWFNRHSRNVRFLLAWLLPVWVLFELVPTKLPHYVLPAYPAIAILIAISLEDLATAAARWRRLVLWLVFIIPALLVGAGAALALKTGATPGLAWFIFAWLGAQPGISSSQRVIACVCAAIGLYVATYSGILTSGPGRIAAISPQLAAIAKQTRASPCASPLLASAGYYEPSLVFLTRTDLLMTDGIGAAKHLAGGDCRMAFVDVRHEPAFRKELGTTGPVTLVKRIRGLNLNGGKTLDIGVWARF